MIASRLFDRGAGCLNWARPDLWELRVSNHPRPPGNSEEREYLHKLISTGKAAARKLAHARVLLACEESDERRGASDTEVAAAVHVSRPTVERVRKAFVEEGLQRALNAKRPRQTRPPAFDGESEAKLIAVACSEPPQGRSRWTMRLLADRLVELQVFESISHETVRQVLKKTSSSLG
jgi:transposase